jgi:hypothetical protein
MPETLAVRIHQIGNVLHKSEAPVFFRGGHGLNRRAGPVAGDEYLTGNSPNIRLGHLVNLIQLGEEFAPVPEAG